MSAEQRIRFVLFYLSVSVFFLGLPFILSFALGYKFNPRTLLFTKAGLIAIKTQPQGASVYLDGKLLGDPTPLTINELLPGKYNIRLELERHYPWINEVEVSAGQVSLLDKIILFPLRPDIKQLNKEKLSLFFVDEKKERIYYIDKQDNIVYRSNFEGDYFKEVARIPDISLGFLKFKISPDREKLLCFNPHQAAVVYFKLESSHMLPGTVLLDYSNQRIIDVFWHSDSYHLILILDKKIEAIEAKEGSQPVNLVSLNKRNAAGFYDEGTDTLYFIDSQKAADQRYYDNVYKLDLSARISPFQGLIKQRTNEQH